MPLPIPNLDDRTFDELVDEAKALIPKYFPAWTDHNFSDPGMTFVDLFAFLIENTIYQINRVPERSLEHFAGLLDVRRNPEESIEALFRRVWEKVTHQERAVTQAEIEEQILAQAPEAWPQNQKIARAEMIPQISAVPAVFPAELRLKIVIVPESAVANDPSPRPSLELRQAVFEFVSERVLIATRLEVLAPQYCLVRLKATVARSAHSRLDRESVRQTVIKAVRDFLHPTRGGQGGHGWPLGRSIFRSELYRIIEGLPGVDHVRELLLLKVDGPNTRNAAPRPESLATELLPPNPEASAEARPELPLPDRIALIEWDEQSLIVVVTDQ